MVVIAIKTDKVFICHECGGVMGKIYPVHSYDFNKDGYVPQSCNPCGLCSDEEEIIDPVFRPVTKFSKRLLKTILRQLCKQGNRFDYETRDYVYNKIKDKEITNVYDLAELITLYLDDRGYCLSFYFIVVLIYKNIDWRFDLSI
jgi:hypothetical protein